MKTLSLTIALALSAVMGLSETLHAAAESATTNVMVQSTKSVTEMSEYVEDVDRRLQKGRYDVVEQKERTWIIEQIAELRTALQSADASAAPAPELVEMASEFETGMIKIEEGGIVCRQERKTGTRMSTQRCYTRKRLEEDAERSRDQIREMKRPQGLPTVQ